MKSTPTEPVISLLKQGNRFVKGVSGNPRGRPKGRTYIARALDELAEADAAEVLAKTLELAKDGDVPAARMILRRAWPVRRGRPIEGLHLLAMTSVADAVTVMGKIASAVADGLLTLEEARDLTVIVEAFRKTFELAELERRLIALEKGFANAPFRGED